MIKKVLLNFVLLNLLMLSSAVAQVTPRGATDNQASSGTIIASVMEQVGYHAQNQVLDNLSAQIELVAALVYLGVLVSILITVGLLGNYRAALWILVGPPLFFYTSGLEIRGQKNTIQGASVEWRFGAFRDTDETNEQRESLNESEVGNSSPTEVSYVFHKYNELVSELFQYLISEITNHNTRSQLIFTSRVRMMEELFAQQAQVPGFIALGEFFNLSCSKEMYYATLLAQSLRKPAIERDDQFETSREEYCRLMEEVKPFPPGPWQDYLFSQGEYAGVLLDPVENGGKGRRQEDGFTTCQILWQGMMNGARGAIFTKMEKLQKIDQAHAFKVDGGRTYQEILSALVTKLTQAEDKITAEQADANRIECSNGTSSNPVELNGSAAIIAGTLAPFIVKKQITTNPYSLVFSKVTDLDHGISADKSIPVGVEPDQIAKSFRREQAHQNSQNRQYEAMAIINFMPFLQGAILYALSVLYPFFCVMLLLPSQAGNYVTWLALWAWAKSWDVGWAFVMVIDEVLWELMPKTAYIEAEGATRQNDPVSMLEIAFDGDHSYNTGTYWLFLTTLVSSVPVISANVILGTKKAVAGTLLKNFSSIAEPFAAGGGDVISAGQGKQKTTERERARIANHLNQNVQAQAVATADNQAIQKLSKGYGDELGNNNSKGATQKLKQNQSFGADSGSKIPDPGGSVK